MPVTINGTTGITSPGQTVEGPFVVNSNGNDAFRFTNGTQNLYMDTDNNGVAIGGGPGQTLGGMYLYNSVGAVSLFTGNNLRLTVDSSGRVTTPFQPGFNACANSGTWGWNSSVLPFDTVITNRGNCYNTATRTFTAPVAGLYVFSIRGTPSGSFGTFAWLLQVNGVNNRYIASTDALSTNEMLVGTVVIYLSANDAIRTFGTGSHSGMYASLVDNEFSGYLLG